MPAQPPAGFAGEQLGRFVAASAWDAVPANVRHEGKRSLLNFMGCALGVARTPPIEMALRVLLPVSGKDTVTVIGRPERLDPFGAAFLNAVGANLLDYDDTHLRTVIHPTAPVAPAVLALAEQRGLPGQAVLHAFILGAEVECRIGNAVSPGHYARGWHITSTCGVFGSAAASAKLLGLDAQQAWHALGIAASQSAGLVENLPNGAKNVSVGNAARNGLFAALLAEQGYTAAPAAIEGVLGWARAMGDTPDMREIVGDLGERWEVLSNTYKPYPCGIVFHTVIDACIALRTRHALAAADIADVTVSGSQLLLDRGDRPATNSRDARVSIPHCAAVALLTGAAGLAQFDDPAVSDPAVAALRGRIKAALDPTLPIGAATVAVRTTDGRSLHMTVPHAKGSTERPLSDAEIGDKARDLARHGAFSGDIEAIIQAAWRIDALTTIGPLMAMLAELPPA
ncbi:MAG TPA: MmgE/PrpD family protein [Rhodopila sp.]|uniref:MmgE/PrpD family protein n=1 Tax=Rhodopila sp. TaxID=2480087 RepID=UPI002C3C9553|nr:MmgE/PrpD family protein [Rhodopila sp.]HVY17211.1 MmgE/PrpD family protein [Rhodopila sp.]